MFNADESAISFENQENLKRLRENFDCSNKDERRELICQLISKWDSTLNLRDIFRPEEMECLLLDSASYSILDQKYLAGKKFIWFVALSGYKDEPKVDKDGKLLLRRITALHRAARSDMGSDSFVVQALFQIYDRFELNYTDESGLSHFHLACKWGCDEIVEKFLELGQDPNCLWQETRDSPIHMALAFDRKEVAELLLRNGSDPNLANSKGSTPLHIICQKDNDIGLADILFEICDAKGLTVQVNALDKLGMTPLQLAVMNILPSIVDLLLNHGSDLSGFVFPAECYTGQFKLARMSLLLAVIERLETRGYELYQHDALAIMKLFSDNGLFEKSTGSNECCYNDEEFATEAKKIPMVGSRLTLYDVFQLRPREAARLLSYSDYVRFESLHQSLILFKGIRDACALRLCEIMARKFFLQWASDPFHEIIHGRLPLECCDMITEGLLNEDLYNICLASTRQNS